MSGLERKADRPLSGRLMPIADIVRRQISRKLSNMGTRSRNQAQPAEWESIDCANFERSR